MFGRLFKTNNEINNEPNEVNANNQMKIQILLETNDKLLEIVNTQNRRHEEILVLLEEKEKLIEEQKKIIEKYEKFIILQQYYNNNGK